MKPNDFYVRIVEPNLQRMFAMPEIALPVGDEARVLVMAIAGQESAWSWRRQNGGPARSYWQFERNGGVAEVLQKTPKQMKAVCDYWDVPPTLNDIFEAMAWHDPLACTMARLLVWQDPRPLPALGDKKGAWDYYLRNWRPGMPHPEAWEGNYNRAFEAMQAGGVCTVDLRQGALGL